MHMKFGIFNQRRQILSVPQRWRAQYGDRKADITAKLDALDVNTCSGDDIKRAIGNDSWHRMWCSCCSNYVDTGIQFDAGDGTADICESCLKGALAVLSSQKDAAEEIRLMKKEPA